MGFHTYMGYACYREYKQYREGHPGKAAAAGPSKDNYSTGGSRDELARPGRQDAMKGGENCLCMEALTSNFYNRLLMIKLPAIIAKLNVLSNVDTI